MTRYRCVIEEHGPLSSDPSIFALQMEQRAQGGPRNSHCANHDLRLIVIPPSAEKTRGVVYIRLSDCKRWGPLQAVQLSSTLPVATVHCISISISIAEDQQS